MQEYLRVFKPFDIEEVRKQLILMGDLSADCGACKEIGLDMNLKNCPHCGVIFKYATSRRLENNPGERFSWAKRTQERRPDLILIDYTDYSKTIGQKKARDFFA